MNICKKKTNMHQTVKRHLNIIRGKYKVSVCDASGILGHSDTR